MTSGGESRIAPAFNQRPLVSFAAGLILSMTLGVKLTGTQVVSAACLSFALFMCTLLIKAEKVQFKVFACALALGFIRLTPLCMSKFVSAPPDAGQLYALANANTPLPYFIERTAFVLRTRCYGIFGEASPLVRAILLGDRSQLTYLESQAYRICGVSHVLALSGLHVGVLSGAVLMLLPKRRPMLRLTLCAAFLLLYCAIAGFPSSLLRASVMTLCMLLAPVFNRKNDPLSSIALACCVILLVSPFRLFSVGFQLSFAATAGALMLSSQLNETFKRIMPDFFSQSLSLTLSATAATLPFIVYYFKALPLYSPFTNLVIVPFITLALPVALAALLLSFIWFPLGAVLAVPARLLLGAADGFAKILATLPYAHIECREPSLISCILFVCMLIVFSKYCLIEKLKKYVIALTASLLFLLSVIFL